MIRDPKDFCKKCKSPRSCEECPKTFIKISRDEVFSKFLFLKTEIVKTMDIMQSKLKSQPDEEEPADNRKRSLPTMLGSKPFG